MLVHLALMIHSKSRLDWEFDKILSILMRNSYPQDVISTCFHKRIANFSADKNYGPQKCPVYLKMPVIECVLLRFESQMKKVLTKCFAAANPQLVIGTRKVLPNTQNDLAIYEFSCLCDARYVCRTSQRLGDRIKQHVPTKMSLHNFQQREQPPRGSKQQHCSKDDAAIGQHLLNNPIHAENYSEDCFKIIGKARYLFHLGVLESVYNKTKRLVLCRQKEFVFSLGLFK